MKSWMSFWNRPKTLVAVVAVAHGLVLLCFVVSKAQPIVQRQPTHLVVSRVKLKPKAKRAVAATPTPAHKPQPAKKSDNRLAKLVTEAQNRLSKVAPTVEAEARQPVPLDLAIDTGTYEQELVERLRLLLKLPEWGSVRVALTVARDGTVVALKILEAQSETNRLYVASHLEGQALAPFGKEYVGEVKHTFRLTLNNEL